MGMWTLDVIVFGVLVTVCASVGLVSIWAAASPRHWIVRAGGLLAFLLPVLLIPAYEPFVILAVQAATIMAGIGVYRWAYRPRGDRRFAWPPRGYSLKSLLAVATLVALGLAIVTYRPEHPWNAWAELAITGAALGGAALLVVWLVFGKARLWLRIAVCVALCTAWFLGSEAVMKLALGYVLWPENWVQVPVDYTYEESTGIYMGKLCEALRSAAALVPSMVVLFLIILTARRALPELQDRAVHELDGRPATGASRWRVATTLLLAAVFVPAVLLWASLMWRSPPPDVHLPNPNGYDDIVAASEMIHSTNLFSHSEPFETLFPSRQELVDAVSAAAPALDRALVGLDRDSCVPITYGPTDRPEDAFRAIWYYRNVSLALRVRVRLAELEGRYDDAATDCVNAIRLDFACPRGGLHAHENVWCAWWASEWLYQKREFLAAKECGEIAQQLHRLDAEREPFDDILYRDRVWHERVGGWSGRLLQIIFELDDWLHGSDTWFRYGYRRAVACDRLLYTQLAVRAFCATERRCPTSLAALVPAYLPTVPVDPFDSSGRPLRLVLRDGEYVVYSVGPDGKDDGGPPPPLSYYEYVDRSGVDDLWLEFWFAPEEDPDAGG